MFIRWLYYFCFGFLSAIFMSGTILCAAEPAGMAEITGTVSGPTGTYLPGASINIRNLETGTELRVIAGNLGSYRAAGLPGGSYEIRAELHGFAPRTVVGVSLVRGSIQDVNFTLDLASLHNIINVIGISPQDSLEAAQARESSARDVGEALAENAGLWKLRKGGIANDVIMRGFQGEDINVLIDGQRTYGACPNHMDPPAFHVDFAEVDRIEIGKGPFDIMNQGSMGGVINIVTRRPAPDLHAQADLSLGSYGFVNPSATVSYGTEKISVLGGYSYRISDPYTDGNGKLFTEYANFRPQSLDSNAFKANTAWAKIYVAPTANQLMHAAYTRQEADHVLYPYLLMDAIYDNTDRFNFGYQITNPSGTLKSIRTQLYYTQVHHWMTDDYRISSLNMARSYSMGTLASTWAVGGKLEAKVSSITFGFESYGRAWNAATEMAGRGYTPQFSIPDVTNTLFGAYVSFSRPLREGLQLDLGGRVDRAESSADIAKADTNLYFAYNATRATDALDTSPSGYARLSYKNALGFEISGGAGHTVREPDPRERYFALRRMGSDWVGNPDLSPSENTGIDFSGAFRRRGFSVNANFYHDWVNDFIAVHGQSKVNSIPGVMNSNARSYRNVDARLYGTELQLSYLMTNRIFLSGDLSYVRGIQVADPLMGINSDNLAEMPPLTSRAKIRYDTGRVAAELEGVFVAPQDRVNTELGEAPTAGYGIANLALSGNINKFTLRIGLNNLLDRYFIEYLSFQRDPYRSGARVPEPGRNLFFNISFRY